MPMSEALARVEAGEDDPPCRVCGGILKSATISFGQALVPRDLMRADEAARACDLLLAIGSSLSVYPVADMVPTAVARSEEHTSELQSLMRISYAVFCLKNKKT